ncbi:bifunctional diaminohydroxyphosphoribosylaminopyrimidine deaminase/5-amino-6-(5-phosphoribosylamino)uracil reductase RibD [Uliginosibacterium sp. 31-16]|uniref:bifunctional diaminohydroxyphosphoribosylaminopyrimidine deaminase/5-amino-6-(5-phosphoribosylamino)uracil reductase RibD n=1 Tax=Uliginosibacterium sp. 31-16 TaxID=3068315 RepID=UPI0027402638|nr:bifunctional diaminohydroxyphosphoribosylaminopyrimidine deaminase/5-amino-6-(5-phosphoribosylamino)uracil reductase RibD [Uliginosibacterium sp. 31-16]MDP5240528.1 bifunctional diaminohydroxyphosphoribosylaminopyrimidine deaminase/5-amino-6-(5-phosphoribosylamino)uracil reductase RibD [Uliginosibacterium sp. 31-16]
MMFYPFDETHMAQALTLAERGMYTTMPNPRVGCVIVRDEKPVAEGWHERAGEPHAEVHALRAAGPLAQGATAYVTLEPCSHFGRTPPCCDALIKAGVRRVVCAMQDPNPLVAGRGLARLREAGIEVVSGILEARARSLNEGFISRMERGRPWLRIKSAASLDGRTALANGVSQWITCAEARADAQHWRARSCAILSGIGTVLADNPRLTVRGIPGARQPLRVIVDSQLRTPLEASVLADGHALIATAITDITRFAPYQTLGAEVVSLPGPDGVDLPRLMVELGHRGINEVLTETGPQLNGALIRAGCADALLLYLAPSLLGNAARGMFALPDLDSLAQRQQLHILNVSPVGSDLRILAQFHNI